MSVRENSPFLIGVTTPALVSGAVHCQGRLLSDILEQTEWKNLPKKDQIRDKAADTVFWKECTRRANDQEEAKIFGGNENNLKSKRPKLLDKFRGRHGPLPA